VDTATQLYQEGRLRDAIEALGGELRKAPSDFQRRTFLFELLCFAGEFDRADKQLDLLAEGGQQHLLGALLYRAAIGAERARADLFNSKSYALREPAPQPPGGELNGSPFSAIEDSDPRLGARLEVFASGTYLWVSMAHIESLEIQAPRRLRDLLWTPAIIRAGRAFRNLDLGEVLLPVLTPLAFRHADDDVRLGRKTVWETDSEGLEIPFGQKMLLLDGEEVPLLEIRNLRFSVAPAA
jgi:type VI secretion system protein ImpE